MNDTQEGGVTLRQLKIVFCEARKTVKVGSMSPYRDLNPLQIC